MPQSNSLTVVIPYYKRRYFDQTLASLADQEDKSFIVFVGDDRSPEDCSDLIQKYSCSLTIKYQRYVENMVQRSLVSHWNRCVHDTTSEWVWLFSDDDVASTDCVRSFRRSLAETGEFLARKHPRSTREILRFLAANWRIVGLAIMLVAMSTSSFYLITAYTPTFGRSVLRLSDFDSLTVTVCAGLSNFFWLPVMGALSDRVGRRPILFACTAVMLATAYPSLAWLASAASFSRLLGVELWLSFLYASYNAAMVVYLTELIPAEARASGFSLAYSVAAAIFGGFTPAICTYLIQVTRNPAAPGLWLSLTAAIAMVNGG